MSDQQALFDFGPASRAEVTGLQRSLGAFQAFTLSISIVSPTLAMAFNVSLAAQAAGHAVPLAFRFRQISRRVQDQLLFHWAAHGETITQRAMRLA
jgi:hypothetical protein